MTENRNKPEKQNGDDVSRMRSWITFPVLDWLIYTPSLRKWIYQLKAEGDFRPEGLRRLHVRQKWTCIISILLFFMMYIYGQLNIITYILIIVPIYTYISICYIVPNREIFPYSIGVSAIATVSHSEYHTFKSRVGGWLVWYDFMTDEGNIIKGSSKNIDKEDMYPVLPKEGNQVLIFYDVERPHKNTIFAPGIFDQSCISISRYAKREQLCNWGVKRNG